MGMVYGTQGQLLWIHSTFPLSTTKMQIFNGYHSPEAPQKTMKVFFGNLSIGQTLYPGREVADVAMAANLIVAKRKPTKLAASVSCLVCWCVLTLAVKWLVVVL